MVQAAECDQNASPLSPIYCLGVFIANQVMRSVLGSEGSANQIAFGPKGDAPVMPIFTVFVAIFAGVLLRYTVGKKSFLPKGTNIGFRAAVFVALLGSLISTVKWSEKTMKELDSAQGANFLPVTALTTAGPYQYTRNPMYVGMMLLIPGISVLTDSVWMLMTMSMVPVYLQLYIIPAEEALLRKLFGKAFDDYCQKVPRWLF